MITLLVSLIDVCLLILYEVSQSVAVPEVLIFQAVIVIPGLAIIILCMKKFGYSKYAKDFYSFTVIFFVLLNLYEWSEFLKT